MINENLKIKVNVQFTLIFISNGPCAEKKLWAPLRRYTSSFDVVSTCVS